MLQWETILHTYVIHSMREKEFLPAQHEDTREVQFSLSLWSLLFLEKK
jgi:hypothetical protein